MGLKPSINGKSSKNPLDRGAEDDWEALKMVLESLPSLKQRVLFKLRELKKRKEHGDVRMSRAEQREYLREQQAKKKKEKK